MDKSIISILKNRTFFEIISELKLFAKYKFYEDLPLCLLESDKNNQIIIFFLTETNINDLNQILKKKLPLVVITKTANLKNVELGDSAIKLSMPFTINNFKKEIIRLNAKVIFQKSSLIKLKNYIINKNERIIKKNNQQLQLTEKEINFLILFSKSDEPVSRNFVLKNIWNYSSESETHTVETHIHRLRKKILEKFGDNDFIKNNTRGYYI